MKKKSKKPNKNKQDNVHQSLAVLKQMILNLEQQIKELNTKVDQLRYFQPYIPKDNNPPSVTWPNNPQSPLSPQSPPPNHPQPYVVWCNSQPQPAMTIKESALKECRDKFYNHNSDIGWDAIDKGLQ